MLLLNLLGLLGWEIRCLNGLLSDTQQTISPPSTSPLNYHSEILRNSTFALAFYRSNSLSIALSCFLYRSILLAITLALSCSIW